MPVPRSRHCRFAFARLAYAILLLSTSWGRAASEAGRSFLQTFTPRDYEAHNQVWMGAQAADGVMWFGNRGAVIAYDGAHWQRIEVPTSYVRTIAFGPDGKLYAGGTDELGFLAPDANGTPHYVSLLEKLPEGLRKFGVLWSMAATADAIFFASETQVLRWRDGAFKIWTFSNKPRQALRFINGALYLHRQGVGLFRLTGDEFQLVSAAPEIASSFVCLLEPDGERGLLVVLDRGPFFHLREGNLVPFPTAADGLLARTKPKSSLRLSSGGLAIATTTLGVVVLDADGNFVRAVDELTGLDNQNILSLTADREGGVWIGTNNGVARAEVQSPYTVFDRLNGLPRALVRELVRHDGILYAVTADGLHRLMPADVATGRIARFERVAEPAQDLWSLASHSSGLLAAGGSGVFLVPSQGASRLILSAPDNAMKLGWSRTRADRLFVGRSLGLSVMRFVDGGWRDEGQLPNFKTEVRTLNEDPDGTLWIGTPTRGYFKVVRPPGDDDWRNATVTEYLEQRGLPVGQGWSHVYPAGDHTVFVTDVGTYRYDRAADRFVIDESMQLAGRHSRTQLWPLAPISAGTFWAQADSENTSLPRALGLLERRASGAAAWTELPQKIILRVAYGGARTLFWDHMPAGDALWVGGPDALVRADLTAPKLPAASWQTLVRDIALPTGTHLTPSNPNVATPVPRFAYAHGRFTFSYSATRFGAGGGTRFQTRLRGYEDSWSEWSTNTEAAFTNLSGGPFTFEVRAQDADGQLSEIAAYPFSVAPPWQRSPLAYAAYGLLGLGVIGGFIRWRLGRAERERLRLEQLVATRTMELAAARDEAQAANRAKSAFLASMSHELRTPLNGVIGYAQLLESDARLAPDQRERVRIVHQSGEHLLRMINDVLDLAKIEAGKLDLRVAAFSLDELLRDVVAAHSAAAAAKRLTFTLDVAANLPLWVEGDGPKLRQVLDNLVGNAMKFTQRGSVTLRVNPEPASPTGSSLTANVESVPPTGKSPSPSVRIAFSITDTGPGISADDQARLFQPFEQARAARPAAPGTGLGLAICRAIVERMGGSMSVASAPGAGSTFSFALALPVVTPALIPSAEPLRILGYEGSRRHVLIVDDHEVNRSLLVDLLQPLGFICTSRESATEALSLLDSRQNSWPDLAIIDVRMEQMDGLELTRRLRVMAGSRALRVLLTSASVLTFNPADGRSAGCDDFLPKPFRTVDLLEKIRALLELRWRESSSRSPFNGAAAPLPADARASLQELLAQGDLEAFRQMLGRLRTEHPRAEAHWQELDDAAAGFQLSRLRQLLEQS